MKCEVCGRELTGNQKYVCSERCRYIRSQKKRPILECPVCGQRFPKSSSAQKYCSVKCRDIANSMPKDSRHEQLCWTCAKATGKCRWSKYLEPVPGWTAVKLPSIGLQRYKITDCPEYVRDVDEHIPAKQERRRRGRK